MSDSGDQWPMPDLNTGPSKHLHAIGVISILYNSLESGMYSLYSHHLDALKIPHGVTDFFYVSLNEHQRTEALKTVFWSVKKIMPPKPWR
jgi:hypothetical protein